MSPRHGIAGASGPEVGAPARAFMVGRQPIFDANLNVHGYELLFRSPGSPRPAGDVMTADVLVHAGLDIGLERLVGTKLAFVNASRAFLVGEYEIPFSPRQTVVEILEDVPRDPEVLAGCRRLELAGYTLALDDYLKGVDDDPFLELVSFVKLDVVALTPSELEDAVRHCSAYGARLVAEKVETHERLSACRELSFDLFQGYLLSAPEIVKGSSLSPSRLACVRVLGKLFDPDASAGTVEQIVQTDAALSYRFLQVAGAGAARGLFRPLNSVRDAVVLLGMRRLKAWVTLMLVAGAHEGLGEQLNIAIIRARMAELIALSIAPRLADAAFTVGLVSALDLLLQEPLGAIVEGLALNAELDDALLGHGGVLGAVLSDVIAWELGGGKLELVSGISPARAAKCYQEALAWTTDIHWMLGDGV